jgi:hypothetical protein
MPDLGHLSTFRTQVVYENVDIHVKSLAVTHFKVWEGSVSSIIPTNPKRMHNEGNGSQISLFDISGGMQSAEFGRRETSQCSL